MAKLESGNTIIEMVLAFGAFSLVAVGTVIMLNRSISIAQSSLETTLVRQQIDAQAEMIRYVSDNTPAVWAEIIKEENISTAPSGINDTVTTCPTAVTDKAFIMAIKDNDVGQIKLNSSNNKFNQASTHARVDVKKGVSYGVWVETTKAKASNRGSIVGAYDFRIHACWTVAGSEVPQTLGTIVRVYAKN